MTLTDHEFCDCLVEMNRHIEELLKLKAEPLLIQAAANDRHYLIEPKAPTVEPPLWSIPKAKRWRIFG